MRHLVDWISIQIARLYPACFAIVMATGIISNALFHEHHFVVSNMRFVVSLIAYPILLAVELNKVRGFAGDEISGMVSSLMKYALTNFTLTFRTFASRGHG